ncbi:MAG TPA: response regulator [Segetibacter sp.]
MVAISKAMRVVSLILTAFIFNERVIFIFIINTYKVNKGGPIIIIEDDIDDQEVLGEVFNELGFKNEIIFFGDSQKALDFLIETDIEPFIIFSDINMPKLTGAELREKVHNNEDLRLKSIPYLFFTTSAEQKSVIEAYSKSIQGFFIKPISYNALKRVIRIIVEYWQECVSPDYVK